MYSFLISLAVLILGYIFYSRIIEHVFRPSGAPTPAMTKADGVDYVPMPTWKVFMIQFLNIAGTGPIFGAIMGAKFGPSSFLWIVLGSIFAGAVHDYFSGMLSLRHGGYTMPDIIGHYFGKTIRTIMLVFSMVLLLLVGAVFVYSPAQILGDLVPFGSNLSGYLHMDPQSTAIMLWVIIVFLYYIIATLLPIDKIIGKIYPLFAFALLFMAAGLCVGLFIKWPSIPEFWDGLQNRGPEVGLKNQPIFPCLFITIACGAISGFHATQSPMMARCLKNERYGRIAFYGAMIAEGFVALIWAAAAIRYANGTSESLAGLMTVNGKSNPANIVNFICNDWLGRIGAVLAILGVVAAPITSGDTALRSARLITADFLHFPQDKVWRRLAVSLPIFLLSGVLMFINFDVLWRYFGWFNQTLSIFTLWALTSYLYRKKKNYYITLLPAIFMTAVCSTYILLAPEGFELPPIVGYTFGLCFTAFLSVAAIQGIKSRGVILRKAVKKRQAEALKMSKKTSED